MSLWRQYGHLWPQALVVSLTVINVCWNLVILFSHARAVQGKPIVEMAISLTVRLVLAAVSLALDTQRIAAVRRPSLTRARIAYYLWIAEQVAIFAGFVVSMNNPESRKKIEESSKKRGPVPPWRIFLMFTPFILGFALWRMNRNLISAERREHQQRQQQQGAVAQNANSAGNQQRQPTRMRLWPSAIVAFNAASSFGGVCYRFAVMSLPVPYTDIILSPFTLYIHAFGLMAIYRRSIPSIRQYSYLLVIAAVVDIAWIILDLPIQNPLPTPEQESQILNLDLDSILSAKPTGPASTTDLLSAEISLAEFLMASIFSVVVDIWMCRMIAQDLEKIEAEKQELNETRAYVQAQPQTQPQIQAQTHTQTQEAATHTSTHATTSERTPSSLQQTLREKQD